MCMKKIVLKIKPKLKRNLQHLEIQTSTRMNVFRDRTKYDRKARKEYDDEEI